MKKILLLTLLSFCLSTNITTKELIVEIDETTESIDIANYLDLESGYYSIQLVYVNLINTNCNEWNFWAGGLNGSTNHWRIALSGNGMTENPYDFYADGAFATISYENSYLTEEHSEDMLGLLYCNDSEEVSLELTLHVSGRFDNDSQTGDINFDGDINVLDIIALVNVIIGDDLGDIFDIIGLINKV